MNLFVRILTFAFQSFWRNIWLSLVTITVLVLALLSINFILILNYIADTSVGILEEQIDVSINFNPDVERDEITSIERFFKNLDYVESVVYTSPEKALDDFKLRYAQEPEILQSLDELDENPLGASLIVKTYEIKDYALILNLVSSDEYKRLISNTSFQDYRELIEQVNGLIARLKVFGYIVSGLFLLISVLIIYNTVRIGVYTHREEIGIMKLVGANNSFVMLPFIVESILYVVMAMIVTIILVSPLVSIVQNFFFTFFDRSFDIAAYFSNNYLVIYGWEFLGMSALVILASGFAVQKYLKR